MRPRTTAFRRNRLAAAAAIVMTVALLPGLAVASHSEASLARSDFEIDTNANLKQDDASPSTDWATLAHPDGPELRATDLATGANDDSYKGGVKEDTSCPGETTGSIPNNKSDLLTFHVYQEPGKAAVDLEGTANDLPAHPGFLNLAWSRVSDPSGTTLMDFEFNQSETPCSDGPNVVRTSGDLLIEYAITQGGAQAAITGRTWDGSAWGPAVALSNPSPTCGGLPCAVGTINTTTIPAAESDGLGIKQARTFGEAQIDLRLVFQPNKCTSFGTAMIKSRSSDAFTSQLKDFISPVNIDLQNCANVIIRKQTDPDEADNSTLFDYAKSFPTDPATPGTFQLADDGVQNYQNKVLLGSGYTVDETALGGGYDFDNVTCAASTGVTPTIDGTEVTFDLDSSNDVLDCTYTNQARGTVIIEKVTGSGSGAFDFTSTTLDPTVWTLTTTGAGAANKDSKTFGDLAPGTYDAAETVPGGWNLTSATCDDGSPVSAIAVSGGETVTCTFTNDRETGAIRIIKTRKHAALGSGDYAHANVDFTITGGSTPAAGTAATTGADGEVCVDGLLVSQFGGNYSVLETVPSGYAVVSANPQGGIVVTESSCDADKTDDATVTFKNMPLTNISVTVNSQVDGGTASVISCDWDGNGSKESVTNTNADGDGSDSRTGLQPGTYTCEVYVDP
jgi:hypothetical protein